MVSSASPAFGWTHSIKDASASPVDPSAFKVEPSLHLPPDSKLLASGVKRGGLFVSEGLVFVNTCEALAKKLECTACEAGKGGRYPSQGAGSPKLALWSVSFQSRSPAHTAAVQRGQR